MHFAKCQRILRSFFETYFLYRIVQSIINVVMEMFPSRLRALRKQRKLTAKEFGEKFNLAESTISGYETGARNPDIETLEKFADFFGVSVDYLLGRTDDPSPKEIEYEDLDDEERQFIRELREIANQKGLDLTSPEFLNVFKAAIDLAKRISEDQRN